MPESLEQELDLIERCIRLMQAGQQAGLAEMLGTDWPGVGDRHDPRVFGKQFKAAVNSGEITGLKWVRIENSGRYDVYERIA